MVSLWVVLCAFWTYVLFLSRPNEQDLREQVLVRAQPGWRDAVDLPWHLQALRVIGRDTNPMDKLNLNTPMVYDLGVVTYAQSVNSKRRIAFVGILGKWIPINLDVLEGLAKWTPDHDIALACALHVLSACAVNAFPARTAWLFRGRASPIPVLLSSVTSDTIYALGLNVYMLVNVGRSVRLAIPGPTSQSSPSFWLVYAGIPALASVVFALTFPARPLLSAGGRGGGGGPFFVFYPMGGVGGLLALVSYGVMRLPAYRFLVFSSFRLSFVGILALETMQHLVQHPNRAMVALLFEVFLVAALTWVVYRVHFPKEVFTPDRVYELLAPVSLYGY